MKIIIKSSFKRDVQSHDNKEINSLINCKLQEIEQASYIMKIAGIKKLKGYDSLYRIAIKKGKYNFRIGAKKENDTIILSCFLKREKFYNLFP